MSEEEIEFVASLSGFLASFVGVREVNVDIFGIKGLTVERLLLFGFLLGELILVRLLTLEQLLVCLNSISDIMKLIRILQRVREQLLMYVDGDFQEFVDCLRASALG